MPCYGIKVLRRRSTHTRAFRWSPLSEQRFVSLHSQLLLCKGAGLIAQDRFVFRPRFSSTHNWKTNYRADKTAQYFTEGSAVVRTGGGLSTTIARREMPAGGMLTGTGAVCLVVFTTRMEFEQQSDTHDEHRPRIKTNAGTKALLLPARQP